jgi:dTDP-4-dehydrorhamnose reductase
MTILLTGAAGQLGSELRPLLAAHGRVIPTDLSTPADAGDDWLEMDISDGVELEAMLNRLQPTLIVNTAAYTAVDQAEANPETAYAVNATLAERLAKWAKRNDAHVLHYSTDYVFNGRAGVAYLESDEPDPKSVYGASKLAGEIALANSGCKHVILRTSWVYSSHGKNFVLSMLNLARKGLALKIVNDQQGCPTWAHNLALASDAVITAWRDPEFKHHSGVYHYCDDHALNWYEFADAIFSKAVKVGLLKEKPDLTPVPSTEFPQPAERPKWSVLDTGKINEDFGIQPHSFELALQAVIDELASQG